MLICGGRIRTGGAFAVARSYPGGGEFGTGTAGSTGSLVVKVGGKRDEEDVGNGKGGGGSSFSGRSISSAHLSYRLYRRRI